MVQLSDIREYVDRVVEEFRPQRVILFGSYARGSPGPSSDVDLLVVTEYVGKPWDLAAEIRNRIPLEHPLDLIVRSPSQFEARLAMGDPFMKEIANEGVVLYDAGRS